MAEQTYCIIVDVSDDKLDLRRLQNFVKEDVTIRNYWNHLPSLFIVTTEFSPQELGRIVHGLLRGVSFVLAEMKPDSTYGYLPEEATTWLEKLKHGLLENHRAEHV